MGLLDQGLDWSNVDVASQGDGEPLPEGEYVVEAVKWEEKVSNAGNTMISMEFTVQGPTHANRKLWENFTLTGNSQVGISRLKAFIAATGHDVNQPLGSALVNASMNRAVGVKTKIEPASNGYPAKAKISSFKPAGAAPAQPAPQQAAPQPAAAPQQPTGQQMNWS
jgi:hypothetical protein